MAALRGTDSQIADREFDNNRQASQFEQTHGLAQQKLAQGQSQFEARAAQDAAQFEQKSEGLNFDDEQKLRKEFDGLNKDFVKVRDAYGRIQASASDPSAAGDLALIFNYMKVLDPGSTVREGEFATAQNAAGVDQRTRAVWARMSRGERLTTEQRQDFVGRAQKLYSEQEANYNFTTEKYRGLATQYGFDPDRSVPGTRMLGAGAEQPSRSDIEAEMRRRKLLKD